MAIQHDPSGVRLKDLELHKNRKLDDELAAWTSWRTDTYKSSYRNIQPASFSRLRNLPAPALAPRSPRWPVRLARRSPAALAWCASESQWSHLRFARLTDANTDRQRARVLVERDQHTWLNTGDEKIEEAVLLWQDDGLLASSAGSSAQSVMPPG